MEFIKHVINDARFKNKCNTVQRNKVRLKCSNRAHLQQLRRLLNNKGAFKKLYKKTEACEKAINNYRSYRKSVMFIINARQLERTKTDGSMFLIK